MKAPTVTISIAAAILMVGGLFYITTLHPDLVGGLDGSITVEAPRDPVPMDDKTVLFSKAQMQVGPEGDRHDISYFWLDAEPPLSSLQNPNARYPMVVVLHGAPGKAYAGKTLVDKRVRTKYPAFVMVPSIPFDAVWMFPQKLPPEFEVQLNLNTNRRELLPYVVLMIRELMKSYPIDPRRIYVIGCSLGGFGAFGAARDYPDLFAAAVSISGGWTPEDAPKLTKIPILAVHGRVDENVPLGFTKDVAGLANEYGGHIVYHEIPDMPHNCPAETLYGDYLWNWMFRQSKK